MSFFRRKLHKEGKDGKHASSSLSHKLSGPDISAPIDSTKMPINEMPLLVPVPHVNDNNSHTTTKNKAGDKNGGVENDIDGIVGADSSDYSRGGQPFEDDSDSANSLGSKLGAGLSLGGLKTILSAESSATAIEPIDTNEHASQDTIQQAAVEVNTLRKGSSGSTGCGKRRKSSSASTSEPPENLQDYLMIKTIGTGTFGRVCLCTTRSRSKYLAMKICRKVDIVRLKQVEHIRSEREILARVQHPFIIHMHASYQDKVNLYMLFEYVVGGELFSHLRKAGRFENTVARFYVVEIVLALEYLHQQNIIYRDLKPENILIAQHGHLKITDFGFAKRVTDRTWTLCGTPEYLAPEIIQSKGHGKAVDWWALGVLTYEMLAGYPPFYDESSFGIYEKVLGGKVTYLPHFDPNCKDFIKKLLTADRTKRLGSLRNDTMDVKRHRWFKGINWETALLGDLPPPIVPDVQGSDDTRNFDTYPELTDEEDIPLEDPFKSLFEDFDCDTSLSRRPFPNLR